MSWPRHSDCLTEHRASGKGDVVVEADDLAVRRPSVTTALHTVEGNGFIAAERGYITIRNRRALEDFARAADGRPEAEYRRLIGPMG